MKALLIYLSDSKPSITISLFRFFFSLVLLFQSIYFISGEFINENIIKPVLLFPFFDNITPLSKPTLITISYVMLVSNIGMLFNKTARLCTITFCICFTYFWLLDKGYFNNHYYFISLMCFLLILVEKKSSFTNTILTPSISILSLQLMVFIVYFVSGLNKLNPYWLFDLQPMKHILEVKSDITSNTFFINPMLIFIMTYLGVIFDLCIGFLLLFKKTRVFAFILVCLFHGFNYYLFRDVGEIGIFPFIMISTLILFLDPVKIDELIISKSKKPNQKVDIKYSTVFMKFILIFMLLQCLLPFRHYLFKGYVDYTGVGQRFSWRMKLMFKDVNLQYFIIDMKTKKKYETNIATMLTPKQYNNLKYFPDLIVPVAKKIKDISKNKNGMKYTKITCDYNIQFMGNQTQKLFNPNLDLSKVSHHTLENRWIIPLKE